MFQFLSYLKVFRRLRIRQVAWFVLGSIIGVILQRLLVIGLLPNETAGGGGDGIGTTLTGKVEIWTRPKDNIVPVSLVPTRSDLLQQLADLRRPRQLSSKRKILRNANDEVRMFELLTVLVHHTSAAQSSAAVSTWLRDIPTKDVELFGPPALAKELRKIEGADSITTSVSNVSSPAWQVVALLQSLCADVAAMPSADTASSKTPPKLHRYKWFALAKDTSYINLHRALDFLSLHESGDALCFARPHSSGNAARLVWSSRPGFLLNQRAVGTICPYLPQFVSHMKVSSDVEAMLSELLRAAGVECMAAYNGSQPYFIDLKSTALEPGRLGKDPVDEIAALQSGIFFSVADELEMYLLWRSNRLAEINMWNRKVNEAHATLVDMQRLMREHPLSLADGQAKSLENSQAVSLGAVLSEDDDTVWMSSDPSYQLSANFDGPAGRQRSAAFTKDVERQLEVACQHLAKKENPLRCVSMVSGYVRFRPSVGMEYMYNVVAKSSDVSANQAKPQHQLVHMLRPLQQIKVSSVEELDVRGSRTHVVVLLPGHTPLFQRFMSMYESSVLVHNTDVALVLVYYPDVRSPHGTAVHGRADHKALISLYRSKYKAARIEWVEVTGSGFNPQLGIKAALDAITEDTAVAIVDVSQSLTLQFLGRCHIMARAGHQAYFPMALSAATGSMDKHGGRCTVHDALCAFKSDIVLSAWLSSSPAGGDSGDAAFLDSVAGALKKRLHIVQAADPDLSC